MTDLLLPLIIIIVMCLIIDYLDVIYPLMIIGFLFIPVSLIFGYQIQDGLYDTLFNADIDTYISYIPGMQKSMQMLMWMVPIFAFLRIYFIRNFIVKGE